MDVSVDRDTPDLEAALDALGLTPEQRLGVEIVAAMKAELYHREDPDGLDQARRYDVLWCLLGVDPEDPDGREAAEAGVDPARRAGRLAAERQRLVDQAGFVGAAVAGWLSRRGSGKEGPRPEGFGAWLVAQAGGLDGDFSPEV